MFFEMFIGDCFFPWEHRLKSELKLPHLSGPFAPLYPYLMKPFRSSYDKTSISLSLENYRGQNKGNLSVLSIQKSGSLVTSWTICWITNITYRMRLRRLKKGMQSLVKRWLSSDSLIEFPDGFRFLFYRFAIYLFMCFIRWWDFEAKIRCWECMVVLWQATSTTLMNPKLSELVDGHEALLK